MKKISIADIAKQAGVSKMTVSRVINDSSRVHKRTRERVHDIIREVGYTRNIFAHSLSKGSFLDVVGVITGIENVFSKYYFMEMMRVLEKGLDKYNHSLFLFNVVEMEKQHLVDRRLRVICDQYHSRAIKGVVVLGPPEKDERLNYLSENGVKGIAVGGRFRDENFGYIDVDNAEGVRMMVNHLASKGYNRVSVINGPLYLSSAVERENAFVLAMKENGLSIREEYIRYGGFNTESGKIEAEKIINCPERPDVIFAMNDDMAVGAYEAIQEANLRIPEDIAVVGFDDIDAASSMNPSLTTIAQPYKQIGNIVANAFEAQDFDMELKVPPILVERKSL